MRLILDLNESDFEVDLMSESRTSRGRPKGTGLDDRARLVAVAKLIATNPDLKATTAIKSTGITDPSTIRRLRDKFQETKGDLIAEIAPAEAARPERAAAAHTAPAPKKRSKPVQSLPETPALEAASLEQVVSVPAPPTIANPAQWMTMWYGLGLQNLNDAVALQISFVEKMMKMPHVATALRGQVAFNEMTLALCPIPPRMPKSLH